MNNKKYLDNYKCPEIQKFISGEIQNLYIYGKCGRGKTFALQYILEAMEDVSPRPKLKTSKEIVELLNGYTYSRWDQKSIEEQYFWGWDHNHKNIFLVDDLGVENTTPNTNAMIYEFIDERLTSGGRTAISTNLLPSQISTRYDDRIASRILGNFYLLNFEGDDWRLKNGIQGTFA